MNEMTVKHQFIYLFIYDRIVIAAATSTCVAHFDLPRHCRIPSSIPVQLDRNPLQSR
jgi:hypothetical protein